MDKKLQQIIENDGKNLPEDEIFSFEEYLMLIIDRPWVTRNTFQLLHDMIISSGVEYTIMPGKPIKHQYNFFEYSQLVKDYVVFGQQKAKENIVEKIDNASRGFGVF